MNQKINAINRAQGSRLGTSHQDNLWVKWLMSLCLLQTAQAGLGQQSPSSIQLVALPRGGQGQGGSSGALAAPASPIHLHGGASSSPLGAPDAGLPLQGAHAGAPGLGAVLRAPLIPAGVSGTLPREEPLHLSVLLSTSAWQGPMVRGSLQTFLSYIFPLYITSLPV